MRAIGVLVALVVSTQVVHADDKAADQLFIDGRALLDSNPKEACDKFEAAYKIKASSVAITLNLGVCHEKQQKLASALKWYRQTLLTAAVSKNASDKDYVDAAKDAAAKLESQVASTTIKLNTGAENVDLYVDNVKVEDKNRPIELDAGGHTIEARQAGKTPHRYTLNVKDGEHPPVEISALADAPKPPSAKNRKLAGVGIALGSIAVASVVAGIWANGIQNDFIDANGSQPKSDASDKMLKPTITFFAIAGLGTAVGAYLFFTKPKWKGEAEVGVTPVGVTAIAPIVTPDSGGVAVLGHF